MMNYCLNCINILYTASRNETMRSMHLFKLIKDRHFPRNVYLKRYQSITLTIQEVKIRWHVFQTAFLIGWLWEKRIQGINEKKSFTCFNPCLTKPFFVTRLTKGGCCNPLWTWKINAWGMLIWYHGIAMGLLFPYIPKKYKHSMYDITMRS